jgi:hypothetical protein
MRIHSWKNTSDFPDAWARPVCEWLCERFQVSGITVKIRGGKTGAGSGNACGSRIVLTIARRGFRRNWKYTGIRHDNQYEARTALEAFVFLAAHEIHHTSPEGRKMYRDLSAAGGHWVQSFEFRTQRCAGEALAAFRSERTRFIKLYRKALARERRKAIRKRIVSVERDSPEFRLRAAEKKADEWAARAEKAKHMAHKWAVKANRIRGAMKRAAAKG